MKFIALSCITLVICGYAYGAHQRNKVWSNNECLWKDVVAKSPKNSRGLMNYGLALMERGAYDSALIYYNKALEITPKYSVLHINIGILKSAVGKQEEAEQHFKMAIDNNIHNADAYYFYARWLNKNNKKREAQKQLAIGLEVSPGNYKIEEFLKKLDAELSQEGRSELDINIAIVEKDPTPNNYLQLSHAYYRAGDYNKCIEACEKAIALKPAFAEAYNNLCASYNKMKEWDKAAVACKKALEISPGYDLAKNNLAWAEEEKAKLK